MNRIEDVFRKLKPILGERIDRLWLAYQSDPKARRTIESILGLLAAKYLGENYEKNQILLEPPAEDKAWGEYPLGTVYYGERPCYSFGLREDEWVQHVSIFGRTGSGKTNVGFLILRNFLEKGKPFLVFDWKRSYRDLIKKDNIKVFTVGRNSSPFYFNPLISPKGTEPTVWLKKLIEILCHAYFLGEGVSYLLLKAIDWAYRKYGVYEDPKQYPAFEDVKEWIDSCRTKGREAMWMDSTKRTIGTLCFGEIGKALNVRKSVPIGDLLKDNVIFELDALTNSDKTFFTEALLLWIHHYRLNQGERGTFKHAILIEEAHHILLRKKHEMTGEETIMDVILREIRELGESIILIDQHPSLISIPALGNTYTTIAMNLKHRIDINTIADTILLEYDDKEFLSRLPVGSAIVKLQGRWFKPFLVRFPLFTTA